MSDGEWMNEERLFLPYFNADVVVSKNLKKFTNLLRKE